MSGTVTSTGHASVSCHHPLHPVNSFILWMWRPGLREVKQLTQRVTGRKWQSRNPKPRPLTPDSSSVPLSPSILPPRLASLVGSLIHTVKGLGMVNKAEIDVFLELSCFFHDPADVGNLISGSSAFSKTSLNIWKFTVHVLLKPGLENFEHYFASV